MINLKLTPEKELSFEAVFVAEENSIILFVISTEHTEIAGLGVVMPADTPFLFAIMAYRLCIENDISLQYLREIGTSIQAALKDMRTPQEVNSKDYINSAENTVIQ